MKKRLPRTKQAFRIIRVKAALPALGLQTAVQLGTARSRVGGAAGWIDQSCIVGEPFNFRFGLKCKEDQSVCLPIFEDRRDKLLCDIIWIGGHSLVLDCGSTLR